MDLFTKEITKRIKNQETASFSTIMVTFIQDKWMRARKKVKEWWNSKMEDSTKETGWEIKCMENVLFHGLLDSVIKDNIWMIRNMVKES